MWVWRRLITEPPYSPSYADTHRDCSHPQGYTHTHTPTHTHTHTHTRLRRQTRGDPYWLLAHSTPSGTDSHSATPLSPSLSHCGTNKHVDTKQWATLIQLLGL